MSIFKFLVFLLLISTHSQAKEKWVAVGDMFVPESSVIKEDEIGTRAFQQANVRLWPGGILRYAFATNVTQSQRQLFLNSCAEMGEFANVSCQPRRAQDRDYIVVQNTTNNVCGSSYLGRYGGSQPFKIYCWRKRTIQHELMHALGVSHEHNRMDRDEHIVVVWGNIAPRLRYAFNKVALNQTGKYLSYYDFDSIMHYGSSSGSSNGGVVMYKKDLGPQKGYISQTNEMSYGDHYFLYALYGGDRP